MENIRIIYLCSAIDEQTKYTRHIQFNNAAATNKVFGLAKALKSQDADIHVVSLGRGKQTGSIEKFQIQHKIIFGFPVHYAAFWHIPVLTHLVGAFSLASLVKQISHRFDGKVIVIAYNRLWHYLPALLYSVSNGSKVYLDLEDGSLPSMSQIRRIINRMQISIFDNLCKDGALLAARTLSSQVHTGNIFVCYGCTEIQTEKESKWSQRPINILFGGSLLYETGVQLLIDTLNLLESQKPEIKKKIHFTITGYGAMSEELFRCSESIGKEWVTFLGDINRDQYSQLLSESHIGLCLKLSTSDMGKTTFPSKIIEYASYGLTVISTRVSDVPDLLDEESAILLNEETPQHLSSILLRISEESYDLQGLAKEGQNKINLVCSTEEVGKNLKQFLLKDK